MGTSCRDFAKRWPLAFPRADERSNQQNAYMIGRFTAHFGSRALEQISHREARAWALENRSHARYARAMFNDAIADGLVDSNPFANLRLPQSRGRRDITVPTANELASLALVAAPPLDRMIPFAAYTGLRLGEQLALRSDAISGDLALIDAQLGRNGRRKPPKGGESRSILIPPQARLDRRRAGILWPISRGQHFRRWKAARKAVGLEDLDWHGLRHFTATWFLEQGASPEDIAVQLGHDDGGELVRRLYGHPDKAKALGRLRKLAA